MASIELINITKRFGTNLVVDDISLEIYDKEFVTLLGPSGCGKTTILRMIAGFVQPDTGEIRVDGKVVSTSTWLLPPERRNMGMVFQNYAVWPHMTVFENVAFGLEMRKIPRKEIRTRVEHILDMVGLSGMGGRYPAQLSGGQQQRVALARSLVVEPAILLLDEPLSNLDAKLREQMRFTLKDLQRRTGITFVYVTHDQAEAMAMSDRVAVIQNGKVQQYATPREVYERPANHLVADFMGLVNFYIGAVEEVDGSTGRAEVRIGESWMVCTKVPLSLKRGAMVMLVVRPEDINLLPPERAVGNYRLTVGTVKALTYLGNFIDYRIDVNDQELRVQAPHSVVFAVGDRVALQIDGERCTILVI